MFCNQKRRDDGGEIRPGLVETKYGGAMSMLKAKAKTTPTKERQAQLSCVSCGYNSLVKYLAGLSRVKMNALFQAPPRPVPGTGVAPGRYSTEENLAL